MQKAPPPASGEQETAPASVIPRMKKKPRVYQEEVKTKHTAHWDWDYLTWEEIEQRLNKAGVGKDDPAPPRPKARRERWLRRRVWIGLGLLLLAVLMVGLMTRVIG